MTDSAFQDLGRFGTGAGLTQDECHQLAKLAGALPGSWVVQEDRDDLGQRSMAFVDPSDKENAPVILAWREDGCLHLGLGMADTYLPLGTHADVRNMMDHVQSALTRLGAVERWMEAELCRNRAAGPH